MKLIWWGLFEQAAKVSLATTGLPGGRASLLNKDRRDVISPQVFPSKENETDLVGAIWAGVKVSPASTRFHVGDA